MTTTNQDPLRAKRLSKVLHHFLSGNRIIRVAADAKLFLEALLVEVNPSQCVETLFACKTKLASVRDAIRVDLSLEFIESYSLKLVNYFSDPGIRAIADGSFLNDLLLAIASPPTFWNALIGLCMSKRLAQESLLQLSWLAYNLLCLPSNTDLDILADLQSIVPSITAADNHETRVYGYKIEKILLIKASTSSGNISFGPGGRHDNDFEDFRSIRIYPTTDEFLCKEQPFYLRASEVEEVDGPKRALVHLDNQFRLLREDMLGELRNGLQVAHGKKRGRNLESLERLVIAGIHVKDDMPCLKLKCGKGLERLTRRGNPGDRKTFLKESKNFLKHNSFGALLSGDKIIGFAHLNRNDDLLLEEPPKVLLRFPDDASFKKCVVSLKISPDIRFSLVNTPVFAYEPILESLQRINDLPLDKNLLFPHQRDDSFKAIPSLILAAEDIQQQVVNSGSVAVPNHGAVKRVKLDDSQLRSIINALTTPVTVIRGPPGTGKTFLGSFLVKTILAKTKLKVLIISFKNHALDDFMEGLLDLGVDPNIMIRLGSKSTAKTEPLLLNSRRHPRDATTWSLINTLEPEAEDLSQELLEAFGHFNSMIVSWKDVHEFLEFSEEYQEYFEAFVVPEDLGWSRISRNNRKVQKDYLYQRWKNGQDPGIFSDNALQAFPNVWKLSGSARINLVQKWQKSLIEERVEMVQELYKKSVKAQNKLSDLRREGKVETLRRMRVIGCTTTAAAMYSKLIRGANPDIVLVEEAGEILESHILTALTPSVKQVVLIGDDKQLRPKVNNYALSVEKKSGFDLNRSLLERLILQGQEHTTLRMQHRMHPEISIFVRELMYPDLLDGPKTSGREPLRGIEHRVVFVNHTQHEVEDAQIIDRRDPEQTSSKQNIFEAKMVLKMVKYLSQQGYGSEKMVVLTPYLGQLKLLQKELSEDNDPWLNELDTFELMQAGLVTQAAAKLNRHPLRLSTIDNYQGEESDIVIVSLTRSNNRGDIGFMNAPERLNVLISRARCGLIMIGNEETFMASKKGGETWTNFLTSLQNKNCLQDGLPVRCEKHQETTYLLKTPEDFDRCCPDGGCSESCGKLLSCKRHKCHRRCHRVDDHSKMACEVIMERTCEKGHAIRFPCSKTNEACYKCVQARIDLERRVKRDLELEKDRLQAQARYAAELERIQDETEHLKRIKKIEEEKEQAYRELEEKKSDLAALKEAAKRAETSKAAEKTRDLEREKRKSQREQEASSRTEDISGCWSDVKTAKDEWNLLKATELAKSQPLDELMDMIGLEDVKQEFLSIKSKIDTSVRQGVSLSKERFGCSLLGNPGTGKTTVARLYAKFLNSVGVISGKKFVEVTGSALANKGVAGCKKMIDDVLNDGGGTVFIDEAYQLTSGNSAGGGAVLDFLLPEVENLTGKIVFVLAGYDKEMESFFSHNPGLPSRFPITLKFADYTDEELLHILEVKIDTKYNEAMKVEDGLRGLYCRIVTRRIGQGRGRPSFGNARAVENTLAMISKRQGVRLKKERAKVSPNKPKPDDLFFTKEDVIGPEPSQSLQNSVAWKKLSNLIGLQAVKEAVKSLCDTVDSNYKRELAEQAIVQYNLNRVFLGNPGTGKTTVAKLYAAILVDLGLLSKGDVVLKNPSDFVGSVLGQSEQLTKGILAAAEGKVLIVDEAYGLYSGDGTSDIYKTAVVDTIVAEVQSVPGDDRCVLLLGYKDQMEKMFQNVNPGLSRRFPLANAFQFDDFDEAELGQILDLKLKNQDFEVTDQARTVVLEMLNRARNRPNFGNAGEIDILLDTAKARHQVRISQKLAKYTNTLEAKDFDENFDRADRSDTNVRQLFRGTVGQEAIMALLEGYQQTVRTMKSLDLDAKENIPFNFLFRGPPGTGKTTTARKMGKVFYDMGFLATAELIDVSATDLVGQYVGHTGPKVQQLLDKALGKVLFIDEAYRLGDGRFGKEAMDELVDCTTKTKYHKRLVIILAGYEKDINSLMSTNPGLTSRFPEVVEFRGLSASECFELLTSTLATKKEYLRAKKVQMDLSSLETPDPKFRTLIQGHFELLVQLDNWASARDVQTLSKTMFNEAIKLTEHLKRGELPIDEELVSLSCCKMIAERQSRQVNYVKNVDPRSEEIQEQIPSHQPITKTAIETTTQSSINADIKPEDEQEQEDDAPSMDLVITDKPTYPAPTRDVGVSDAVWEQLQADKEVEAKAEEEFQALIKARDAADDAERNEIVQRLLKEEERRKKELAIKQKLALMGKCPMGFEWIKQSGGYRCAGGSHFLSGADLKL